MTDERTRDDVVKLYKSIADLRRKSADDSRMISMLASDIQSLATELVKLREATAPYDPPESGKAVTARHAVSCILSSLDLLLRGARFKLSIDSNGEAGLEFLDSGYFLTAITFSGLYIQLMALEPSQLESILSKTATPE